MTDEGNDIPSIGLKSLDELLEVSATPVREAFSDVTLLFGDLLFSERLG